VREQKQAVARQQAPAVEAQAAPCTRVDHQQTKIGARAQVRGQRIAGERDKGEVEQAIVGRPDEAGRTAQERGPGPVLLVQGGGDREPLAREQGPDRGRDLRGERPPDPLRVLAGQEPGLDLDLARVKGAHNTV
jgi:hypothetical protein